MINQSQVKILFQHNNHAKKKTTVLCEHSYIDPLIENSFCQKLQSISAKITYV